MASGLLLYFSWQIKQVNQYWTDKYGWYNKNGLEQASNESKTSCNNNPMFSQDMDKIPRDLMQYFS